MSTSYRFNSVASLAVLVFGCGAGLEWEPFEGAPEEDEATWRQELSAPRPHCIAASSASDHNGNLPKNVLDGDLGTRWSAEGDGAWLALDLKSSRTLSAMDVAWYQGDARTASFSVETSADGATWRRVFRGQSSGTSTKLERVRLTPSTGRYVRIVGHGNSVSAWNSITELRVYAARALSAARVTASGHDGNVPGNAVDESLQTRWSAEGAGAWLQLDLGEQATLTSADVAWYRGDERSSSFALRTSTDGARWARAFEGRSSGTTLEPERVSLTPVNARYLRLVGQGNTVNAWNSVTLLRPRGVPLSDGLAPAVRCAARRPPDLTSADFDSVSSLGFGSVTRAALDGAFRESSEAGHGLQELAVVSAGSGKYLRQRYRPNADGSARVGYTVRTGGGTHVWLSYRMYFEPGFEFVKGGKLPGLCGGTAPTGGEHSEDGFTARMMWRRDGELVVYAYHHDRPSKFGEDLPLRNEDGSRWRAPVGRWFTVRQRLRMNSTGSTRDGEVEVWIDGAPKLLQRGLRWRMHTGYAADRLCYSSFYGGSDSTWAPSKTTYIRFDDFRVASTAGGVD